MKIAFKGQATPWVGMNPPGTLDTVDVNHLCPYDQAKAKALLAEVGYGPAKPLTFELMADTEKSVFNVIATVIKEQMARIGVTANIRLVDKVSWMNTTLQDGPWDMYVEDLLSLITLDSNGYLSNSTSTCAAEAASRFRVMAVEEILAHHGNFQILRCLPRKADIHGDIAWNDAPDVIHVSADDIEFDVAGQIPRGSHIGLMFRARGFKRGFLSVMSGL